MNKITVKTGFLLTAVAVALFAWPPGTVAAVTPELKKVIEAAKQEKKLSIVMGSMGPTDFWRGIERLLLAKYGVKVQVTYTAGANFSRGMSRLIAEYKSGQVASTDATLMTSRLAYNGSKVGMLKVVDWAKLDPSLPKALINSTNTGLIVAGVAGGIVFNTNLIKEKDVPRTLDQLADPKYKGMMVGTSVATQWPEVAIALGEARVTATLKKMVKNGNFVGVLRGCGGHEPIAAGQFPMLVLTCTMFQTQNYIEKTGAPLGLVFLDDVRWVAPYHWIIPKRSRNPNVAILVGLVLAMPEGQKLLDKWQGRSSPYIPGTRIYNHIKDGRASGRKMVVSDWTVVTDPRYNTLFLGKTRKSWRKLLGSAGKK